MKLLVIITGASGTGKSTCAKYLNEKLSNSTFISMDKLKEDIYDIVGFYNETQKKKLEKIIKNIFKTLLKECMEREDEIILIEYPFSMKWKKVFENLINKYNYEAITLKVYGESFETIWKRIEKRDFSQERHIGHLLDEYRPIEKETYKRIEDKHYKTLKSEYDTEKYTTITLGKEIKIVNKNGKEIEEVINCIK